LGRIAAAASLQPAQVNGYPALILWRGGEIDTVMAVRIDDGLITGLYAVRNPELGRRAAPRQRLLPAGPGPGGPAVRSQSQPWCQRWSRSHQP
jgi:hypothetical protein